MTFQEQIAAQLRSVFQAADAARAVLSEGVDPNAPPLLQLADRIGSDLQNPPIAYGLPYSGDVFPWDPEATQLAGIVWLYSAQEIQAFQRQTASRIPHTPDAAADHLAEVVARAQNTIAQQAPTFRPTPELITEAKQQAPALAADRARMLNAFRSPV